MNAMTQPIEIALDETGVPEDQILTDSIRPWRSDCKVGQFKVGASTMRGKTLDLEIVGAQISEGEYFAVRHEVA